MKIISQIQNKNEMTTGKHKCKKHESINSLQSNQRSCSSLIHSKDLLLLIISSSIVNNMPKRTLFGSL